MAYYLEACTIWNLGILPFLKSNKCWSHMLWAELVIYSMHLLFGFTANSSTNLFWDPALFELRGILSPLKTQDFIRKIGQIHQPIPSLFCLCSTAVQFLTPLFRILCRVGIAHQYFQMSAFSLWLSLWLYRINYVVLTFGDVLQERE